MKVYVYGLTDPRTGRIHYVGQTSNLIQKRIGQHIARARMYRDSLLDRWLLDLLTAGTRPAFVVLEETDDMHADAVEVAWIKRIHSDEAPLVNTTHTGQEPPSTAAVRARIAAETEEWRQRAEAERAARPPAVPPPPDMTPAEIVERRTALGLSQRQIAEALDYNHSAVSLWESGKRKPPPGLRLLFDRLEMLSTGPES